MSNIDEEFQKIISGMSPEQLPETTDADALLGEYKDLNDALEAIDPLDIPEDESLHLENGTQTVGCVLAPFIDATQIAHILEIYGIERWVVQLDGQVAIWCELEAEDNSSVEQLLGDERPMPEECDAFARVLSQLSPLGVIAVVSNLSEEDGEVSGSVRARRYLKGKPEEIVSAGLLLAGVELKVEDLLLGRTAPQDYSDSVKAAKNPKTKK
ncbi:hypothetical protein NXS08_03365 [Gleimia sp. 6138-11-ORH1]|uniref:hypothetical protein n=1 Tax=Gleimia sp. 6138-11-ORH1 TaxID=2973937 RepID=UPI002167425D|nr:hypothetical protein [Gleimia sp. 6138-11-ORH1]MCS4484525.1 hypothetical protein [Gleimia sp. 6138-11-ORH1]